MRFVKEDEEVEEKLAERNDRKLHIHIHIIIHMDNN